MAVLERRVQANDLAPRLRGTLGGIAALSQTQWGNRHADVAPVCLVGLQVHKLQEQIPLEKEANKAHRLRQQLWSLQVSHDIPAPFAEDSASQRAFLWLRFGGCSDRDGLPGAEKGPWRW